MKIKKSDMSYFAPSRKPSFSFGRAGVPTPGSQKALSRDRAALHFCASFPAKIVVGLHRMAKAGRYAFFHPRIGGNGGNREACTTHLAANWRKNNK
jgi:hypothetical protein